MAFKGLFTGSEENVSRETSEDVTTAPAADGSEENVSRETSEDVTTAPAADGSEENVSRETSEDVTTAPAADGSEENVSRETSDEPNETELRLFEALVSLDGRIANPKDIHFSRDLILDEVALENAITTAIEANPRISKNFVSGDIGQGSRGSNTAPVDLISAMRAIQ